jgi:thioredoxin 1
MVKELDLNTLMEEIKKGKHVVDFWAPWCGPCKMFAPVFEKVSAQVKDVEFVKVNVQDHPEAANKLGISSIPTLVFFKDGEEVLRFSGVQSEDAFKAKLEEVF